MLSELTALAQSSSKSDRRGLLFRLTDLFLEGADAHTDREAVLYADIVLRMIEKMDTPDRAEFAEEIADRSEMPKPVVCTLAHDEIDVAGPVLSRSPVLSDQDLVSVIQSKSHDYALAVTKRDALSETVTDSLFDTGDVLVARSVSANRGARFSEHGIAQLAAFGATDAIVRRNSLGRSDIRKQVFLKIKPLVSPQLAAELRLILAKADDKAVSTLEETAQRRLSRRLNESRFNDSLKETLSDIETGKTSIDDALDRMSDGAHMTSIISLISALSRVPEHIVSSVLFKMPNEPVCVLLRSIGAGEPGYTAVQAVRARRLRLPNSHVERGLQDFRKTGPDEAKRSLRFLRARMSVH